MTTTDTTESATAPGGATSAPSGRPRPAAGTQIRRPGGRPRRPWGRRRVCQFCVDHVDHIDYKSVNTIRRYVSERARMESSKRTGTCSRHQRMLRTAIIRARFMALLPFGPEHERTTDFVAMAGPESDEPVAHSGGSRAVEAEADEGSVSGDSEEVAEDSPAEDEGDAGSGGESEAAADEDPSPADEEEDRPESGASEVSGETESAEEDVSPDAESEDTTRE